MHKIMEFRYIPPNELNVAKRKVVKKMRRNAKNEPNYAMTTEDLSSYTEYYKSLVELNDLLYNVVLYSDIGAVPPVKGVYAKLVSLLSMAKQIDMTNLSSSQKGDLTEQVEQLAQRYSEMDKHQTPGFGRALTDTTSRPIIIKILKDLDQLIKLMNLKLSAPVSGGGFLLPRHLM